MSFRGSQVVGGSSPRTSCSPGMMADRVGRRPALVVFAALSLVLPVSMFAFMSRGHGLLALTGAVVLALVAGGVSAVGASCAPEQFPVAGRLSGLAVATVATTIFGGLTPYAAQALIDGTGWRLVPGIMVAAVPLLSLPILWRLPETARDRSALSKEPPADRGGLEGPPTSTASS